MMNNIFATLQHWLFFFLHWYLSPYFFIPDDYSATAGLKTGPKYYKRTNCFENGPIIQNK